MITIPQPPAQQAPKEAPIRPGAGGLTGSNPLGRWVEFRRMGSDFSHPYLVTVSKSLARVDSGLVIGDVSVQPVISKVPIGGDDRNPQPLLKLSPGLVNDKNESWVCVEVTPDAAGKLDSKLARVEVVQRAHPIVQLGVTGRAPLAMLVYRKGRWETHQIAFFHFRYETSKGADGSRRHYFL